MSIKELDKYDILRIGEILEVEFGQCLGWGFGMHGNDYYNSEVFDNNENLAKVINRYIRGDKSFIENYIIKRFDGY